MKRKLVVASGIVPGPTGVGTVISLLLTERKLMPRAERRKIKIFYRAQGLAIRKSLSQKKILEPTLRLLRGIVGELCFRYLLPSESADGDVVLIHPQTLGYKWTLEFIRASSRPVWLYLMDCSFFCVRSYNYLSGENGPCLRCMGGNFINAEKNNCEPLDGERNVVIYFLAGLLKEVRNGKLRFLAQNEKQVELARRHFGAETVIKHAGIWASDWRCERRDGESRASQQDRILFHGDAFEAKGFLWTLNLAARLPEYTFLFPFDKPEGLSETAPNCIFKNIRWTTGLSDMTRACSLVLVPSLWSAPIEGALIKSLAVAPAVAVVENKTAFSSELSNDLLLRLSADPEQAAGETRRFLKSRADIPRPGINAYLNEFQENNQDLLGQLITLLNTAERRGNEE